MLFRMSVRSMGTRIEKKDACGALFTAADHMKLILPIIVSWPFFVLIKVLGGLFTFASIQVTIIFYCCLEYVLSCNMVLL